MVRTILVVDDMEMVLNVVVSMLKAGGYRVIGVSSSRDALAEAELLGCGLSLLLTDMRMPGMDGHELIGQVRKLCPLMDVMVMTGEMGLDDSRLRNYRILNKPFTQAALLAAVEEIMGVQL